MRSAQLVNHEQFYVSISRARNDARVYTNDAQALRRAVREPKKEIALMPLLNARPRNCSIRPSESGFNECT